MGNPMKRPRAGRASRLWSARWAVRGLARTLTLLVIAGLAFGLATSTAPTPLQNAAMAMEAGMPCEDAMPDCADAKICPLQLACLAKCPQSLPALTWMPLLHSVFAPLPVPSAEIWRSRTIDPPDRPPSLS